MLIKRYLNIDEEITQGKVLVLYGPRRVGKTTLLQEYLKVTSRPYVFLRGDELRVQHAFSQPDTKILSPFVQNTELLLIDEAQMIPNIGKSLKLLVDTHPELLVIVTGSSSFELAGQVGEPLTGRKRTKYLLPISVPELFADKPAPAYELSLRLDELLIFGMYPDVLTVESKDAKTDFLAELVDSYLLKDILAFQEVKSSRILLQLLNLLAFQIGNEVSLNELSSRLEIDKKTVARYLDLLEKSYIVFRLGGLSRNLRTEVTKKAKYFFYDTGVRNAVIGNFNTLEMRNDVGQLWENFVVVERLKRRLYYGPRANHYFWRTWKGSEIDLVEEREGKYFGYEMKWKQKVTMHVPREWIETYPKEANWQIITQKNLWGFLTK